jgi:hypothetical protein
MDKVLIQTADYKGRTYSDFHVRKNPGQAPGWFVFGRNEGYGGRLISLCARPDVPLRKHPHYNCRVQRGWLTKREAQAVADQMNNGG